MTKTAASPRILRHHAPSIRLSGLKDWTDQGARPSPKRDKVVTWEPLPADIAQFRPLL
jgi:hypothetical protein